eukprot:SAG31_NODE_1546_length_7927_cov_29.239525_4_plen_203_part_00
MFSRLQLLVLLYFVLLFVDHAIVQQVWQQDLAWKAQLFDQMLQVLIVISLGFLFRPKQSSTGAPGARYFLDSTDISTSSIRRPVPFYEMEQISGVAPAWSESNAVIFQCFVLCSPVFWIRACAAIPTPCKLVNSHSSLLLSFSIQDTERRRAQRNKQTFALIDFARMCGSLTFDTPILQIYALDQDDDHCFINAFDTADCHR